jgi:hypothetical protein
MDGLVRRWHGSLDSPAKPENDGQCQKPDPDSDFDPDPDGEQAGIRHPVSSIH